MQPKMKRGMDESPLSANLFATHWDMTVRSRTRCLDSNSCQYFSTFAGRCNAVAISTISRVTRASRQCRSKLLACSRPVPANRHNYCDGFVTNVVRIVAGDEIHPALHCRQRISDDVDISVLQPDSEGIKMPASPSPMLGTG